MKHLQNLIACQKVTLISLLMVCFLFDTTRVVAECTYEQNLKVSEYGVGIMITWATSVESNNSVFMVQRSTNGKEFSNVGTVKGAGNSKTTKPYHFLDASSSSAKVYYRLRQVDYDGTFSHTEIAAVVKKLENNMTVVNMGNENVTKEYNFTLDALQEGDITILIKDGAGKKVSEQKKHLINGLNNIRIDVSSEKEGTYKIVLIRGSEEKTLVIRKTMEEVDAKIDVASGASVKVGKN
jgi:hypothetical protein